MYTHTLSFLLQSTHPFLLPKTSTFSDVADALAKLVTLDPQGSRRVRIFEIASNGRQQKECTSSEMIANLREPAELYAEEIPLEETNLTDDAKVIDVFHYHREPTRYFGVPFRFVVKNVSKIIRFVASDSHAMLTTTAFYFRANASRIPSSDFKLDSASRTKILPSSDLLSCNRTITNSHRP
jgi:hypothetical protein